jgi:hypothetical protein
MNISPDSLREWCRVLQYFTTPIESIFIEPKQMLVYYADGVVSQHPMREPERFPHPCPICGRPHSQREPGDA